MEKDILSMYFSEETLKYLTLKQELNSELMAVKKELVEAKRDLAVTKHVNNEIKCYILNANNSISKENKIGKYVLILLVILIFSIATCNISKNYFEYKRMESDSIQKIEESIKDLKEDNLVKMPPAK